MQLIVLGMHRSGTSVLARILNLMGAYFGPEGISTGANPENPKGFWERRDVRALNDAVLHASGADWDRVTTWDLAAVPSKTEAQFLELAGRLVLEMDAHRPWLLKEPRLCLLLPLWRRVLQAPVVVHLHRNPIEVASSLQHRNSMPLDAGLALWEIYLRHSLEGSAGLSSTSLFHSDLMSRPLEVVERLRGELLALGVTGLRSPSPQEIDSFVERGLYRQRSSEIRSSGQAIERAMDIYAGLRKGGCDWAYGPPEPSAIEALRQYEAHTAKQRGAPARHRITSYGVHSLAERIRRGESRLRELEEKLENAELLRNHMKAEQERLQREAEELARINAELERRMSELEGSRTWAVSEMLRALRRRAASGRRRPPPEK